MKKRRNMILRREHFGGLSVDTGTRQTVFLTPEEYELKRQQLLDAQERGEQVKLFNAIERGYPLVADALSSPGNLYFELTKKCNSACRHCFMDSGSPRWTRPEMSLSEIEPVIRQFSDLGGYYVRINGGEPTVREDFFDVVDIVQAEGIMVGLNTNGLFGAEVLEGILSRGVKDIRVSLDGPAAINDSIRQQGSYAKIIRTLRGIAEYNQTADEPVDAIINVVLMKSNKVYIKEMIDLAQDFGFKISFGLMRLTGRAERQEMLSPQETVQAAYTVQSMREKLGLPKGAVRVNYDIFCETDPPNATYRPYPCDNSRCSIGTVGINLDAYGRIAPCGYFVNMDAWTGEDIRGKDMLGIWHNSRVFNEVRRSIKRQHCRGCQYHMVRCNGGCPFMAYMTNGDLDGKDPYCVRDVDIETALGTVPG